MSWRAFGNVFEQERRWMLAALEYHLDQAADVFVPGNSLRCAAAR